MSGFSRTDTVRLPFDVTQAPERRREVKADTLSVLLLRRDAAEVAGVVQVS